MEHLAGRYLPQRASVRADAHVGPAPQATGQLRAGVGTRPTGFKCRKMAAGTEPRKVGRPLQPPTTRAGGSAIQIEEGKCVTDSENRFYRPQPPTGRDADAAKPIFISFYRLPGAFSGPDTGGSLLRYRTGIPCGAFSGRSVPRGSAAPSCAPFWRGSPATAAPWPGY